MRLGSCCLIPLLLIPQISAEMLFGDHFDGQPDWDMSQDDGLLSGWTEASGSNRGGLYQVGYINSLGAHGRSGKGFIQYWDKTDKMGSAQDCWLVKRDIQFPSEWYLGYWLEYDPNWDWGEIASLKLLKIHTDTCAGDCDWYQGETFDIYRTDFCAPLAQYNAPAGCGYSYCTDDQGMNWFGCWESEREGWHYYIWHFDHDNGVLELKVDGKDAKKTSYPTDFAGDGWNKAFGLSFGGNPTDGGGGLSEMWTRYDDIVIATTEEEVVDFLGLGSFSSADTDQDGCIAFSELTALLTGWHGGDVPLPAMIDGIAKWKSGCPYN